MSNEKKVENNLEAAQIHIVNIQMKYDKMLRATKEKDYKDEEDEIIKESKKQQVILEI